MLEKYCWYIKYKQTTCICEYTISTTHCIGAFLWICVQITSILHMYVYCVYVIKLLYIVCVYINKLIQIVFVCIAYNFVYFLLFKKGMLSSSIGYILVRHMIKSCDIWRISLKITSRHNQLYLREHFYVTIFYHLYVWEREIISNHDLLSVILTGFLLHTTSHHLTSWHFRKFCWIHHFTIQ